MKKLLFCIPLVPLLLICCDQRVHRITRNSTPTPSAGKPAPSLLGTAWTGTWETAIADGTERFFFDSADRVVWQKLSIPSSASIHGVVEKEYVLSVKRGSTRFTGKDIPHLEFRVTQVVADTSERKAEPGDGRLCFPEEKEGGPLTLECTSWQPDTLYLEQDMEKLELERVEITGYDCTLGSTALVCQDPIMKTTVCPLRVRQSMCRDEDTLGCGSGRCEGDIPGGSWAPLLVEGTVVRCLCPHKGFTGTQQGT